MVSFIAIGICVMFRKSFTTIKSYIKIYTSITSSKSFIFFLSTIKTQTTWILFVCCETWKQFYFILNATPLLGTIYWNIHILHCPTLFLCRTLQSGSVSCFLGYSHAQLYPASIPQSLNYQILIICQDILRLILPNNLFLQKCLHYYFSYLFKYYFVNFHKRKTEIMTLNVQINLRKICYLDNVLVLYP